MLFFSLEYLLHFFGGDSGYVWCTFFSIPLFLNSMIENWYNEISVLFVISIIFNIFRMFKFFLFNNGIVVEISHNCTFKWLAEWIMHIQCGWTITRDIWFFVGLSIEYEKCINNNSRKTHMNKKSNRNCSQANQPPFQFKQRLHSICQADNTIHGIKENTIENRTKILNKKNEGRINKREFYFW